jgi:hypothetical protein
VEESIHFITFGSQPIFTLSFQYLRLFLSLQKHPKRPSTRKHTTTPTRDIISQRPNGDIVDFPSEFTKLLDVIKDVLIGWDEGCADNEGWYENGGLVVGWNEGWTEVAADGWDDGFKLGRDDGLCDGDDDGLLVGSEVGGEDGRDDDDGTDDGLLVGCELGWAENDG